MKLFSSENSLIKIMIKLDFLVTFQFGRVVFDGFVPILEGHPVSVCPHHPEGDFFFDLIMLPGFFMDCLRVFSYGEND